MILHLSPGFAFFYSRVASVIPCLRIAKWRPIVDFFARVRLNSIDSLFFGAGEKIRPNISIATGMARHAVVQPSPRSRAPYLQQQQDDQPSEVHQRDQGVLVWRTAWLMGGASYF